jgi:hypothetical protein
VGKLHGWAHFEVDASFLGPLSSFLRIADVFVLAVDFLADSEASLGIVLDETSGHHPTIPSPNAPLSNFKPILKP